MAFIYPVDIEFHKHTYWDPFADSDEMKFYLPAVRLNFGLATFTENEKAHLSSDEALHRRDIVWRTHDYLPAAWDYNKFFNAFYACNDVSGSFVCFAQPRLRFHANTQLQHPKHDVMFGPVFIILQTSANYEEAFRYQVKPAELWGQTNSAISYEEFCILSGVTPLVTPVEMKD